MLKRVAVLLLCVSTMAAGVSYADTSINSALVEIPEVEVQQNDDYLLKLYNAKYGEENVYSMYSTIYSSRGLNLKSDIDDYFTKIEWIDRGGVISLSLYPSEYLLDNPNGNVAMAKASTAWGLVEDEYSSDSKWDNGKSLEAQFHCHAAAARGFKTPWNLEPHRTETDLWETMKKKCNP